MLPLLKICCPGIIQVLMYISVIGFILLFFNPLFSSWPIVFRPAMDTARRKTMIFQIFGCCLWFGQQKSKFLFFFETTSFFPNRRFHSVGVGPDKPVSDIWDSGPNKHPFGEIQAFFHTVLKKPSPWGGMPMTTKIKIIKNIKFEVLEHAPIPGFKKAFHIVVCVAGLYLVYIFSHSL